MIAAALAMLAWVPVLPVATATTEVTLCSASGIGTATCTFTCPANATIFVQWDATGGVGTGVLVGYAACVPTLIPFEAGGASCTAFSGPATKQCLATFAGDGQLGLITGGGNGLTVSVRAWYVV